jgi:hypothetical protein
LFRVMGGGMRESIVEDGIDFGEGVPEAPPMRAGRVLVAAERALEEEGIPYAFVDGGDVGVALAGARFVLVPTSCGLDPPIIDAVRAAQGDGVSIAFAPAPSTRDGSFRPLSPRTVSALPDVALIVGDDAFDIAAVRAHVQQAMKGVPRIKVRPVPCSATVHRDGQGSPRVVFLVNPTKTRHRVEATIPGVTRVRDLFDASVHLLSAGVPMEPASIRFCEVVEKE